MAEPRPEFEAPIASDTLFAGQLVLGQFPHGHRAGTDAVLLAAAADVGPGDRFIDVGAGSGAVGLWLGLREPRSSGVLVEIDAAAAALARRNAAANGLADRVAVTCVDVFDRKGGVAAGLPDSASLVVTNPPFYEAGTVRRSPDTRKAGAHVFAGPDGQDAWLRRAITFLRPNGRLVMISRPEALALVTRVLDDRLGGIVLRAVHAKAGAPAIRILVGARRGTKAAPILLPSLVLHGPDGAFTPEAADLHDGGTMALWPKTNRPRRADPSTRD